MPSQCRQKLSKILHLSKFADLFELFQKKHLKMGTVSMLKIVCSSVLLAAVLTTFVLSWVLQGQSEMEVSCTSFTDVWCCR